MSHAISKAVSAEVAQLSPAHAALFHSEMNRRAKSGVLGWFLALLGLHYAYLGRWGMQVIFWLTFGGFMAWWFVDLFRAPGLIKDANTGVAMEVLASVRAVKGS